MTKEEKEQMLKENYLINIKGDLLFLVTMEVKLDSAKTRKERIKTEKDLDDRLAKIAKEILMFYSKYSGASYSLVTLGELRLEILLWLKEEAFFEDYIFQLLKRVFQLRKEYFETLTEDEDEVRPCYWFNFKKIAKTEN